MFSGSGSFVILVGVAAVITGILGVAVRITSGSYNSGGKFVLGSCNELIISISTESTGANINTPSGASGGIICRIRAINVFALGTRTSLVFCFDTVNYNVSIIIYCNGRSNSIFTV